MSVIFISNRQRDRAENMKAVYDALRVHVKGWMTTKDDQWIRRLFPEVAVIDEFRRTPKCKVLMIGHGIDGAKTYGYDQPKPYITKAMTENISCYVTSGTGTVSMVAHCSGLPVNSVLPLGIPRTDAYVGKVKGDGKTKMANYRSYLYVPTFRNRGETKLPQIDWEWLDKELTDNELLVVKRHPETKRGLNKKYQHIVEVDPLEPSAPYLIDCDVVITDYSSIMFDGYLLKKPCVLFEKDTGYIDTRGMYFKYPDHYSSRYATNEHELIEKLREADRMTEVEERIIYSVANKCDGKATERVCGLIHDMLERW